MLKFDESFSEIRRFLEHAWLFCSVTLENLEYLEIWKFLNQSSGTWNWDCFKFEMRAWPQKNSTPVAPLPSAPRAEVLLAVAAPTSAAGRGGAVTGLRVVATS